MEPTPPRASQPVLATRTSTRLLEGLHDASDERSWLEFDRRYRPIVLAVGRRLGLSEHDAAEAAQDTMLKFLSAYRSGRYDRSRGRLRTWIATIARNRIMDLFAERRRKGHAGGHDALHGVAAVEPEAFDTHWVAERRRAIMLRALEELPRVTRIGQRSIRAFEITALQNRSAADAAAELDMTVDDVYQARRRITRHLRQMVEELEVLYDEAG